MREYAACRGSYRAAADFAVGGAWKCCYGGDAFGQAAVVGDDGAQACRYGVGVDIAFFYHEQYRLSPPGVLLGTYVVALAG